MGLALSTVHALRQRWHDIQHLSEEGLERLHDSLILEKARREEQAAHYHVRSRLCRSPGAQCPYPVKTDSCPTPELNA